MAQITTESFLQRRWIALTFSFALVALATSTYLFYREFYRPKRGNRILEKYGYLFREATDQKVLDKIVQSQPLEPVELSKGSRRVPPRQQSCTLSCTQTSSYFLPEPPSVQADSTMQSVPSVQSDTFLQTNNNNSDVSSDSLEFKRVLSDNLTENLTIPNSDDGEFHLNDNLKKTQRVHHGCCHSYPELFPFKSLPHAYDENKILRIVQFKRRKQRFQRDVCLPENPCKSSCKCVRQNVFTVALVVDTAMMPGDLDEDDDTYGENDVRLDMVKYLGWCKCINT